jgi:rubrerythrin|tara:strand:+ start:110 stop:478 length:369 start_codon:yes stop_codon:yes gene_type:complete
LSKPNTDDIYDLAERALDIAILEKKFLFKLYPLLEHSKATRKVTLEFLESSTARAIEDTAHDLEEYIKGGKDAEHTQIREAYHFLSKPEARKIVKYLRGIIDDAKRYEWDHRPGRRKKSIAK